MQKGEPQIKYHLINNFFDIVIFGFCLYVCDESDYKKKLKKETLRITKKNSFIIIQDFYSPKKLKKNLNTIKIIVIKQDFTKIFIDKKIKLISRKLLITYLKNILKEKTCGSV